MQVEIRMTEWVELDPPVVLDRPKLVVLKAQLWILPKTTILEMIVKYGRSKMWLGWSPGQPHLVAQWGVLPATGVLPPKTITALNELMARLEPLLETYCFEDEETGE